MNKPNDPVRAIDPDDIDCNDSPNEHFNTVLNARLSRRSLLRGGMASAATAIFGAVGLSACSSDDSPGPVTPTPTAPPVPAEKLLAFAAVPKSLADMVSVPAGYTASVIYALGDPLNGTTPAYKNDGTDDNFDTRAGDHHDGMEFYGLSATGSASTSSSERGLLAVNHEATTDAKLSSFFLHANGGATTLPRPAAEVDKEIAIHGVSVVEVKKTGTAWAYVRESSFNRRLTPLSDIELSGPARGNALLVTKYSPTATKTRGTLNNCGTGKSPWGSFLTGEENWAGYFTRGAADDAARGNDKSVTSLKRYGRAQGAASRHGWESAGSDDKYARWDISRKGASLDGSDDYRNDINGMGYIVEMDPYDKSKSAKKRTALGRYAHESAAFGNPVAGQPLAVYMGDDSRNEYIYKFVSSAVWAAADASATDRVAMGDKYLDSGKLYVARMNPDGSGQWIELNISNAAIAGNSVYKFADQADVLVNARLAADAVGATKMDRPEWCSVNPANGEIYYSLTNNSNRAVDPTSSQLVPDGPNPRAYTDMKGSSAQSGNPNGHLLRMKEGAGATAATSFTWDVYLFGAEAGASGGFVNLSSLTADQDFSSPDGLAFSPYTGICWIQTDDGAYTDVTNCMMLAAIPGTVGDGAKVTLNHPKANGGTLAVDTYVGKKPTADTLKRFLVGPSGCEITGLCETPDGKSMFINIQHPGETTAQANLGDPSKYTSQWPSNAGYGAGKRPRSATIVITKNDGGRIGT
ncbi:PhoX family protein [Massilia antarctica]|uniref:PhoX family protein n=1 Tax=Massilia antarctica TaxID=2765360 RepID=UPI0006BB8B1F|nr:PhoX family phosphatase [Massilia sp. H27-R4]MCY0915332.1 PhoX family phosphatase [Massilia sp. H27-R4]CUI05793.1 Putative phosphatase [Janthinobacterium sp. CG23_2]CUU29579.1 Putative phosphatase [Janthinobacterium sp. CG23_2]